MSLSLSLSLLIDPPNVDVSPKSFILNQSQPVNFTCTSYGIPLPVLSWYDNRNTSQIPLVESSSLYTVVNTYMNTSGFSLVESILVFPNSLRTDMSTYTCQAVNGITNLLDTPETGNAILYVQSKCIC